MLLLLLSDIQAPLLTSNRPRVFHSSPTNMSSLSRHYRENSGLKRFTLHSVTRTGLKLGTGSFGTVEEVKKGGTLYAGKVWHEALLDPENEGVENMIQRFEYECELMSQVRHPNIVQFMGICFMEDSPYPVLVMERLDISLDGLLQIRKNLPLRLKLHVLHDVSKGLVYLHSRRPPIVHRDLTTCNVLLNKHSLKASIADLGNARMIEPGKLSQTLTTVPGTQVYMPPEATSTNPVYDSSLDVFSFGHLALYTAIQVFPSDLLPATYHDHTFRLFPRSELERRGQYMDLLHSRVGKTHALVKMIERSLNNVPKLRPTSEAILNEIVTLIEVYEDEFDIIHEFRKLELFDDFSQGNEGQKEHTYGKPSDVIIIKPGEPELLDIYTSHGSALRRRKGWKQFVFLLTDTTLKYKKANKDVVVGQIPLKKITCVNAVKSSQFSDTTKYYFEVHFSGDGSPWLLRAYSKEKRESWIKTLADTTPQGVASTHAESYTSCEYVSSLEEDIYDTVPDIDLRPRFPSPPLFPPNTGKLDLKSNQSYGVHGKVTLQSEASVRSSPIPAIASAEDVLPTEEESEDDYYEQIDCPVPPSADSTRALSLSKVKDQLQTVKKSAYSISKPYDALPGAENADATVDKISAENPDEIESTDSEDIYEATDTIYDSPSWTSEDDTVTERVSADLPDKKTRPPSDEYEIRHDFKVLPSAGKKTETLQSNSDQYDYVPSENELAMATKTSSASSSGSGCVLKHSYSTPAYLQARSRSAGNMYIPQYGLAADPTYLQLNILIQNLQQMLAQMQTTYEQVGQTFSTPPQAHMPIQAQKVISQELSSTKFKESTDNVDMHASAMEESISAAGAEIQDPGTFSAADVVNPESTKYKKECLRELLSKTKLVDHHKLFVTDDKSNAAEVPECFRASTSATQRTDVLSEDDLKELEKSASLISKSSISEKKLIPDAKGRCGEIYHAKLKRDNITLEVVVKTLAKIDNEKDRSDFAREQAVMSKLMHPNIVGFHGIITDEETPSIVLEFLPNGDMQSFLKTNQRPVKKLLKYMLDVSMGMHYLAEKGLVHRDLAARNILLGGDEICKVGDFGLLRKLRKTNESDVKVYVIQTATTPLPFRWMAPESLDSDLKQFSTASDVWSFAVLQWEMKNPDKIPYGNIPDHELSIAVQYKGRRLDIPKEYPPEVRSMMQACWNQDPTTRPSFFIISNILARLYCGSTDD